MANQRTSRPPVIRLFPDHAGTVLWLRDPVDYAQTALSTTLVAALQGWERNYYESLTEESTFLTKELARSFTAEGNRLAGIVAAEVGSGFAVEFSSYERFSRRRYFNSPMPATNPAAATCFAALLEADDAAAAQLAAPAQEEAARRTADWAAHRRTPEGA